MPFTVSPGPYNLLWPMPSEGSTSPLSLATRYWARPHCFMLEVQLIFLALSLALESAGSSIAARIAMMAMTTSSSISVNACRALFLRFITAEQKYIRKNQVRNQAGEDDQSARAPRRRRGLMFILRSGDLEKLHRIGALRRGPR